MEDLVPQSRGAPARSVTDLALPTRRLTGADGGRRRQSERDRRRGRRKQAGHDRGRGVVVGGGVITVGGDGRPSWASVSLSLPLSSACLRLCLPLLVTVRLSLPCSASFWLRLRTSASGSRWHPLSGCVSFCQHLLTSVCFSLPPSVVVALSRRGKSSSITTARLHEGSNGGLRAAVRGPDPSSSSPPEPPPSSSLDALVCRPLSSSSVAFYAKDEQAQKPDHEVVGFVWRGAGQYSGCRQLPSRATCVSARTRNNAAGSRREGSGKPWEAAGL